MNPGLALLATAGGKGGVGGGYSAPHSKGIAGTALLCCSGEVQGQLSPNAAANKEEGNLPALVTSRSFLQLLQAVKGGGGITPRRSPHGRGVVGPVLSCFLSSDWLTPHPQPGQLYCCPRPGSELAGSPEYCSWRGASLAFLTLWAAFLTAGGGKGQRWRDHFCTHDTAWQMSGRVSSLTFIPSGGSPTRPLQPGPAPLYWSRCRASFPECCIQWGQGQLCTVPGHPRGPWWLP